MATLPNPTTAASPYVRSLRVLARINLRQARDARRAGNALFAAYHLRAVRDFRATIHAVTHRAP